jgi:hypothetical protein
MRLAANVYDACKSWKNHTPGKEGDWKEQNPDAWDVIMWIQKLRKERDGGEN